MVNTNIILTTTYILDKPLPTTTIPSNTTVMSLTSTQPILLLLPNVDGEEKLDDTTAIVASVVSVILILTAAVVTINIIIRTRMRQLQERKAQRDAIRKFSYLPTT